MVINKINKSKIQDIGKSFEQRKLIKFPKLIEFQQIDTSNIDNDTLNIYLE